VDCGSGIGGGGTVSKGASLGFFVLEINIKINFFEHVRRIFIYVRPGRDVSPPHPPLTTNDRPPILPSSVRRREFEFIT